MRMWDSTDRGVIPRDAPAVAGYGGPRNHYQSYWWFVRDYPNARHVFILNQPDDGPDGHQDVALDMEKGDARAEDAVPWVRRQWARGVRRPILYAQLSIMEVVLRYLRAAGIPLSRVRIWTAHPTGKAHRCTAAACGYGMPGAPVDATQCVWSPNHVNVDISELADDFFEAPAPVPPPPPVPPKETDMIQTYLTADHRVGIVAEAADGEVLHIEQQGASGVTGQNADWWRDSHGQPHWLSLGKPGQ